MENLVKLSETLPRQPGQTYALTPVRLIKLVARQGATPAQYASQSGTVTDFDPLSGVAARLKLSLQFHSYSKKCQPSTDELDKRILGPRKPPSRPKKYQPYTYGSDRKIYSMKLRKQITQEVSPDLASVRRGSVNDCVDDVTVPFDSTHERTDSDLRLSGLVINGLSILNAVEVASEKEILLSSMAACEEGSSSSEAVPPVAAEVVSSSSEAVPPVAPEVVSSSSEAVPPVAHEVVSRSSEAVPPVGLEVVSRSPEAVPPVAHDVGSSSPPERLVCEFDGKPRQVSVDINKSGQQVLSVKCWYARCMKHFRTINAVLQHENLHVEDLMFCKCPGCRKIPFNCQCTKCCEVYRVTVDRRHPFIMSYLKDGVWIECTKCAAVGRTLMSRADTEISTVDSVVKFVCDGLTCKRRFSTLSAMCHHRVTGAQCTSASRAMHSDLDHTKYLRKDLYKCSHPKCRRRFKKQSTLRIHELCHKEGNSGCVCTGCTHTGNRSNYYRLTCSNCQKEFCIFIHGKSSLLKEFTDEGILIQCTVCQYIAIEQIRIQSDTADKALDPVEQVRIQSDTADKAQDPAEQVRIHSETADKALDPAEQVRIHSNTADKALDPDEQMRIQSDTADKAQDPAEQVRIHSDRADKVLDPSNQVRIHSDTADKAQDPAEQVRIHSDIAARALDPSQQIQKHCDMTDKPRGRANKVVQPRFVCNISKCECRIFQTLQDMTWHRLHRHPARRFSTKKSCEKCKKVIDIRHHSGYESHLSTCSANIYPLRCETCGRLCRNKEHLKIHQRNSHGDKLGKRNREKMVCDICGRLYSSMSFLNTHIEMVHHNRQLEAPSLEYKCPDCDAAFNHVKKLTQHKRRVHKANDVLCSKCGKTFRSKRSMLYHHERAHEEKQPKKLGFCTICNKSFSCKLYLKKHRSLMHGEVDNTT